MDATSSWSIRRRFLNVFAIITTVATFGLLFLGGLVTSFKVGMAVPDWPTTFHENMFSYYFFDKGWGIQLEHSHRLVASGIGLLTIVLGVAIGIIERRMWVLGLGALAIVLVITQGILGGMRVQLNDWAGTDLAALHGCLAQIFFALTVILAAVTSRWWVQGSPIIHADAGRLQRFTLGLAIVVYLQIILGANVRHYGSGPMFYLHFGLAGLILMGAIWAGLMVLTEPPLRRRLGIVTIVLLVGVGMQIMLGMTAMSLTELLPPDSRTSITTAEAATTTTHLVFGSIVFAASVFLSVQSRRLLKRRTSESVVRDSQRVLETVA